MPLQNRLLPTGEIVANTARGTLTGNRGILHIADGVMGQALWRHKAWICCTLDWKGRKRQPMSGRQWTALFFLDEAVAFAAGHRPCAYCRRAAYNRFKNVWTNVSGKVHRARDIDTMLHAARIVTGTRSQKQHTAQLEDLPFGTIVLWNSEPNLVTDGGLHPYSLSGYGPVRTKGKRAEVTVLTPAPVVNILREGYLPSVHQSAWT